MLAQRDKAGAELTCLCSTWSSCPNPCTQTDCCTCLRRTRSPMYFRN